MALEDYKISNDTIMCWDSDGRLNTNIWPGNLKVNQVSTILPRLDDFALIKGLVLDGDEFKQYAKVQDSLYLMCDEVKKLRNQAKRAKVASPILNQLKKYMKEEGFVWDPSDGDYPAPTNNLPQNKNTYIGAEERWRDTIERCYVEISPTSKEFSLVFYQEEFKFENEASKLELVISIKPSEDTRRHTYQGFTEENFEQFKKDWTSYKEHLPARLEEFKKEVEERKKLLNTPIKEITDKLKALHYISSDRNNYNYVGGYEDWYKIKKLEGGLSLRGSIGFHKVFRADHDFKITYTPLFSLYQGADEIWDGGAYWNWRAKQEKIPKEITPTLLQSILGSRDNIVSVDSIEEANKIIEKGFADFDDAFSDEEIGFDGHESLSLTEALKRLRNSEED